MTNVKILRAALRATVAGCVILLYSAAAALPQDVRYNYVSGTIFSKNKTYKWVRGCDAKYPDQITDGQIKQATDSQLSPKGLFRNEDAAADLHVAYQLANNRETQWYVYGGMGWRLGIGTVQASSLTINIGTLVLDLYDVAAKQRIWRGDATKTLNPSKDPQKNQKKLQKAMAKLLKNFPPPAKK